MQDHIRPPSRGELTQEIRREVAQIQSEFQAVPASTRCRVCLHPDSRQKVNALLGYGVGLSEILKYVEDINEKRSKNNKITIESIRNHKANHFPIQAQTMAGYRRILERRNKALLEEYGEAAENILSSAGFLEIVAHKGFQNLIDEDTIVDYETGLKARMQLDHMLKEGAVEESIAKMRKEVGILQQAVTDVAKENPGLLDQITSRIDELTGNNIKRTSEKDDIVDAEVVPVDDFYDSDDDYEAAPILSSDDGDSIEE